MADIMVAMEADVEDYVVDGYLAAGEGVFSVMKELGEKNLDFQDFCNSQITQVKASSRFQEARKKRAEEEAQQRGAV